MPETLPASNPPGRGPGARPGARPVTAWVLYLLTLLSAYPLGAVIARSLPPPEGACSGIGFGCTLYGADAARFFLVAFGVPYAVGLAVVLALLGFLPARWRPAQAVVAGAGLAVPWVLVLLIAAGPSGS